MTGLLLTAAEEAPDPSDVSAGWAGLIVLVLLAVATVFLLRSMNKRLKGIDFDEDPDRGEPGRDDGDDGRPIL
uniref:Uncharacterized protein n=1 Tax=uncultured Nocardioidaceae bacterium TaxID=253824 RepID=A0A6J4KQN6_9ACTN|nr:MAG: hypothetical protein AVDCRST_MAG46-265 [uncultured Nocardioidaceae bacterium]